MNILSDEDIIAEMARCKSDEVQAMQGRYLAKLNAAAQAVAAEFPFDQPYKVLTPAAPSVALLGSLVTIRYYYDDGTVGVSILRPGNGVGVLDQDRLHAVDPQALEVYTPRAG